MHAHLETLRHLARRLTAFRHLPDRRRDLEFLCIPDRYVVVALGALPQPAGGARVLIDALAASASGGSLYGITDPLAQETWRETQKILL